MCRIGDRKLLGAVDGFLKVFIKAGGRYIGRIMLPKLNGGFKNGVKNGIRIDKAHDKIMSACLEIYNCSSSSSRLGCAEYYCVYSIIDPYKCQQECGPLPPTNCVFDDHKHVYHC